MEKSAAQVTAERLWGEQRAHELWNVMNIRCALEITTPAGFKTVLTRSGPNDFWLYDYIGLGGPNYYEMSTRAAQNTIQGVFHFEARNNSDMSVGNWQDDGEFRWLVLSVLGDKHPEMYAQDAGCVSFWPNKSMTRLLKPGRAPGRFRRSRYM